MAIFAIGDMHLSLGTDKPMDVFPGWEGYLPRLEANWRKLIGPDDTVILAGDTSWAMNLNDTKADFAFIQNLPGQKWLLKGNHDYWWTTTRKMETFLAANGFDTLHILHNNACIADDTALCGTRGWPFDDVAAQGEKLMAREAGRLRMSLQAAGDAAEKIAFLHYPPIYPGAQAQELVDVLLSTPNMEQRTVGIGRLDPEIARDFSNVGPMVRASGHARDTRADHPFVGYGLLPMEVHSEQGCDVISRLKVRINEVYTALNMIDYGLDNLPGGPLMVEGFTYIPHRFALGFAEAPRGDDIHWSMTGDNQKLYRWRCRAATYANWPTLRYMLRGNTVSDAPLIIGSLDPCYSCTDRMTVVDVRKKKSKVVPYKELERYSIERKNSPLK